MTDSVRKLLPGNVEPIGYRIRLEPDFDSQSFVGSVEIMYAATPTMLLPGDVPIN